MSGFILARAYGITSPDRAPVCSPVHKEIDGGSGCVRLSLSWFTTDQEVKTTAKSSAGDCTKCGFFGPSVVRFVPTVRS